MSWFERDVVEAIDYIRDVGPPMTLFRKMVEEGSDGSEEHTMRGDDFAGYCHHFNVIAEYFGLNLFDKDWHANILSRTN